MNEISEMQRLQYEIDATKAVTAALFGKLNQPRRKVLSPDFESIVGGDEIEIAVIGDYQKAERDTNTKEGYTCTYVWLQADASQTNIISLLKQSQIDRLNDEGRIAMSEANEDDAAEAAQARYECNREYSVFGMER